jgi:two-component system NtrC family sensor kinase
MGILLYLDILIIFNIRSEKAALFVSRLDHMFVVYAIPVFIHFFHAYLGVTKRRWLIQLSYIFAFSLMPFAFTPLCIKRMNTYPFGFYGEGGECYLPIGLGAGFAVLYSLGLLLNAIQNEKRSIQRNKLKYILAGFGMLGILNGLNVLPLLGYPLYPPGTFSFIPLAVFSIGLFKYDLLDMGSLIKKSLLYSLISAVFTCLYALIITLANELLYIRQIPESLLFPMVFLFFVTILFGPVRSFVHNAIDGFFIGDRVNYHKSIQYISQLIVSSLDINAIATGLTTNIFSKMQIDSVALFLKENGMKHRFVKFAPSPHKGGNGQLISMNKNSLTRCFSKEGAHPVLKKRLLERSTDPEVQQAILEMENLGAEIVFPLTIESRCIGFLVLGEKKSGWLYTREEIDLLSTLSMQLTLAIENARSYRRLDALNRHLEDSVQQRTQALQRALTEKEKSNEQMIRSESLAAIGQLVSGVAHELNNPLSAAISLIQSSNEAILSIDTQDTMKSLSDRLKGDMLFAQKELIRVKQIVASLLGLSRQTHTYTESVNISGVVRDALKVLQGYIKQQDITVIRQIKANLPTIQGNFANLGQVAINIIKNACQAVQPSKGVLHISTQYLPDSDKLVFACRDNGAGISESIQKDIYKPFFTTKSVGHGTGLGLYICHEIIQRHQGTIVYESTQGKGTLFRVYLPVSHH